ncbi:MAG: TatD family hydrolase [Alphaproteobacteria bacterium]
MWIDSHCHLTHERIRDLGAPEALIVNAHEAGVAGMLTISCQITGDFKDQLAVARAHQNVWCSIGTHPHDAGHAGDQAVTLAELVALSASDPKIIAIGESGLDYHYTYSTPEEQDISFRKHIRACLETGLPLIVHSREAEADTMRIIREESAGATLSGVMHCFSSKPILAQEALEIGFYISFSGIVTFNAAEELRAAARDVPLERILVETDAPYLAPTPHRGKTNHPAYVVKTGEFLADFLNVDRDDFAAQTSENFFNLFPKARETWQS